MFDLRFVEAVYRALYWCETAPHMRIANQHEKCMEERLPAYSRLMQESQLTMSTNEKILNWYIRRSYAPYFGLRLRVSDYVRRNLHTSRDKQN